MPSRGVCNKSLRSRSHRFCLSTFHSGSVGSASSSRRTSSSAVAVKEMNVARGREREMDPIWQSQKKSISSCFSLVSILSPLAQIMDGKWCSASHPSIPLSAQPRSIPSIEKTECHLMVPYPTKNGGHPFFFSQENGLREQRDRGVLFQRSSMMDSPAALGQRDGETDQRPFL
jgi:hypothetical protein